VGEHSLKHRLTGRAPTVPSIRRSYEVQDSSHSTSSSNAGYYLVCSRPYSIVIWMHLVDDATTTTAITTTSVSVE
jgi:hypothetical protein